MKKYDSYKETDVQWLGKVPTHWLVKRLKYHCQLNGRIGYRGYTNADIVPDDDGAITLGPSNLVGMNMNYEECKYLSWPKYYESPEIMVHKGDIIFAKTASVGKVGYVRDLPKETTVNPQLLVINHFKDIESHFLAYVFQTSIIQSQVEITKVGSTIPTISQEKIGNYLIPVPPICEQKAIADFLDAKTSELEKEKKNLENQIELLRELKQSIITKYVTLGLCEDVETKASPIQWLPSIPKDWDWVILKATAKGKDCCFIDGDWIEAKDISESGIKYITTGNVGVLKYKEQGSGFITEQKFVELDCTDVLPGDVLISRLNEPIGRACIVPDLGTRVVTSVDNVIYRPDLSMYDKRYIVYVLNCTPFTAYANILARGTTMHRISRTILGHMKLPVPSIEEQKKIADFLDAKVATIDEQIELQEQQIKLIDELKQSIISQAVTGKIKVI